MSKTNHHAGDCTIYSAVANGSPWDGVCTCGYGWALVRSEGDYSEMVSDERAADGARSEGAMKTETCSHIYWFTCKCGWKICAKCGVHYEAKQKQ